MGIEVEKFGSLKDGREVEKITIKGKSLLTVSFLTYGARVQSLVFDGTDTVLGFNDIAGYESCTSYQGAIIGRYANRIDNGEFVLNATKYDVGANSNGVHLHGGETGFDKKIWNYELFDSNEPCVLFKLYSEDGDMGYPGNLRVEVRYTVTDNNELKIEYSAISDDDTIINLTNHCYFNIGGEDCLDTLLSIDADSITPLNKKMIPTGEILPVDNTPFDLRSPLRISEGIHSTHEQIVLTDGYDHNFVLNGSGFRRIASAFSPVTGIVLECSSDRPGMQLYTSNCLGPEEGINKDGKPLKKWQAFCMETQSFPDSPNKPDFPSVILKKGVNWISKTVYSFSKKSK